MDGVVGIGGKLESVVELPLDWRLWILLTLYRTLLIREACMEEQKSACREAFL